MKSKLVDMAISPEEKKVVEETNSDDDVLAQLGYTQGKIQDIIASIIY